MATINITNLNIGFSDQFFFDTNVWLLIYGTIANYQRRDQNYYSNLLSEIIQRDKPIFITSMVISEFANVLLRHDFRQWNTSNNLLNQEFKRDYVGTPNYVSSVVSIKSLINRILGLPVIFKVSDNFNSFEIDNLMRDFSLVDFNDACIAELARLNNYKVVTNDADFKLLDGSIDIITSKI